MLIKLTQEEIWASNILTAQVQTAKAELQRVLGARGAYINLLESKYDATFDNEKGLVPNKKDK